MFLVCNLMVTITLQDMLISLKMMVLQRVKVIGCYELSEKFDLKILRALGMPLRMDCISLLTFHHKLQSIICFC